ncbi:MAG: hypothetical protein HW380_3997 [Magnetococcales bacterium]|nr:hypothetical protein [Magnetococcales bacterium]
MDAYLSSKMPTEVADRLGYYVYLYTDPRTGHPFYVGKGQGQRVLSHLSADGETRKTRILEELNELGKDPQIDILTHALPNEETALRIEAAIIDFFGLDLLSNAVRGWQSIQFGRMPLKTLVTYYAAAPGEIDDPVLLIRINKLYRHGMSARELYEATRGVWKLNKKRVESVKFAFSVFEGVVREVFEVDSWYPAGSLPYETRSTSDVTLEGRWEFEGHIAMDDIRNKYIDRSVKKYLPQKAQNPISYVNA